MNKPDVDLNQEVKVDGQSVTLGLIAKVIDFDDYLSFVEENFDCQLKRHAKTRNAYKHLDRSLKQTIPIGPYIELHSRLEVAGIGENACR